MTKFRELQKGQWFDWIDDSAYPRNTFFKRCVKTSERCYDDETGLSYRVGTINAKVFHVAKVGDTE